MVDEAWSKAETDAEGAMSGREKHTVVVVFPLGSVICETDLAVVHDGLAGFSLVI